MEMNGPRAWNYGFDVPRILPGGSGFGSFRLIEIVEISDLWKGVSAWRWDERALNSEESV
jgi:hypothetical protein